MSLRFSLSLLAALVLCVRNASAQATIGTGDATDSPAPATETGEKAWSLSASVYGYLVPDDDDYAQPTITFDRDWLHVEARYNYEDLETGSAWIGYNFAGGDELAWELTPMVGGVFGQTDGVAPGYKGSLSWSRLELYSEGEYVFDSGESPDSFFYNWSELTVAPVDWFRVGMVTQRTRAYETDREIQRGALVGLSYKAVSFTTYVFNPDQSEPTVVLGAGLTF